MVLLDQPALREASKVMGGVRLVEPRSRTELAHAQWTISQGVENREAEWVREASEELG